MKFLKMIVAILLLILTTAFIINYPKLKLISGFAAKNMATSYFLAKRSVAHTTKYDNGGPLVKLATSSVDTINNTASSSVFGLSKQTAIYQEGIGAVLVPKNFNRDTILPKPHRDLNPINQPYPYGNLDPVNQKFSYINYQKINELVDTCFIEKHPDILKNTRSILILHKGQIIAEKYAEGYSKNSLLQGWSMTKSLLTTSFGVLQKEGYDIYKPITAFTNWLKDDRKNITTDQLLRMEAGIKWEEDYGKICDVTTMLFDDEDCTTRALNNPLIAKPDSRFEYESSNSNILSALLRKQFKTHQEYLDFPYKTYIDKIGMHSMTLETDLKGNYVASSYSWATTRDWAKFGQLMLQNGEWNGEQILSKDWVKYITTPNKNSRGEFGGQWWLNDGEYMPNCPKNMFYADGYQGQRLFIIPDKDLIVVRFGVTQLQRADFYDYFDPFIAAICKAINY